MIRVLVCALATAALYVAWTIWVPLLPTNLWTPLLDLGKMTGYRWPSAWTYLTLILALISLYGAAYRMVSRGYGSLQLIVISSAVFCCVLLFAYPATAVDVFGYIAQGRLVTVHHANPFTVAPADVPNDAILPFLAFPGEPSQYGPLWALISAAVALLGNGNLVAEMLLFKAIGALAHLASGLVVYRIAAALGADLIQARACALVYLWNPLLLWEMVGNAHNDGLMMLGGLLAFWALATCRTVLPLALVAVGALVKVPLALVTPIVLVGALKQNRARAIEGALLAVVLSALVYRPFWAGIATVTALRRTELFTASLGSVVRLVLAPSMGGANAIAVARTVSLCIFGVFIGVALIRAVRANTEEGILTASYLVLLAGVLFATTWFQAWYVIWPLALGAALPRPQRHLEVALLSLGGLLQYFVFIYLWVMDVFPRIGSDLPVQSAAYLCVIGPLAIGVAARRLALEYRVRTRFGSR